MTTIACDLKHMVGDRRITIGELYFPATKIFKVRGDIVGTAGDGGDGDEFIEWYRKQSGEKPVLDKDTFEALVLKKDGIYYYDYTCLGTKIERGYAAIGNGALGALCAMKHGATPKEAIEDVSEFSHGTGRETDSIEL
jgi:20S proteasome alpha/beta subunit